MSKTIVSLSFDDGRRDTYTNAYSIMKKYGIIGTVHIATAFIDRTWQPPETWVSGREPMTPEQMLEMYDNGIEISSHGDRHTSEKGDYMKSLEKLKSWGIDTSDIGFSMPNSSMPENEKNGFVKFISDSGCKYIRGGRNQNCYGFVQKILYVLYTLFGFKWCYNGFNKYNLNKKADLYDLNTVVVKSGDKAEDIIQFIEKFKHDSHIILMFHSITGKGEPDYGRDKWFWDKDRFDVLCAYLKKEADGERLRVDSILNVVRAAD